MQLKPGQALAASLFPKADELGRANKLGKVIDDKDVSMLVEGIVVDSNNIDSDYMISICSRVKPGSYRKL